MEFDRRTRYAATDAATTRDAPVPGKQTLTQDLVPLHPAAVASPERDRMAPATPDAAPPTGPRPTLQALFANRRPAPDPEQVGAIQRSAATPAGAPPRAGDGGEVGGSHSTATPSGDSGTPLPDDTRDRMGQSFGADFSAVRVHQGGEAEAIGAVAYARGSDLHFASGQYDPHGAAGQRLLAHELAHVVQQSEGRVAPTVQAKGLGINDDAGLEREADESADRAVRGEPARPDASAHGASRVAVQARRDAPVQGFFRTSDLKVDPRDQQQGPFTTQAPRPEAKPNEDSTGIDITRGGGPVAPSDVALRVADDLTMAIHDSEAEPKEFYATHHVIATANAKLAETESSFRLDDHGGNSITVGPMQLSMVKPVNQRFAPKQEEGEQGSFASLIRHLCIEMTGELVGNKGQMSGFEAVFRDRDRGTSFTEQINPDPQRDNKVDRLGAHLAQAGHGATPDDAHRAMNGNSRLPEDYARDLGRRQGRHELDRQDRQLGINEHALPDVGEGYAIFSQASTSRPNGDYATRSDGGAVHRDDFWGYHFAGVVARSVQGDDRVCLENYNRTPDLKETAGAVLLDLPKYREQVRVHREKYPEDTVAEVVNEIRGSNPDAEAMWNKTLEAQHAEQLWFFRMYGIKEGQTFHEQQHEDGGVVNPITLHVRRSVPVQKRDKADLVDRNVQRCTEALGAVALPEGPARDELRQLVTALQNEGAACKGLIDGAVDNASLMQAVRDAKARFTQFIEGDLVAGLRRVYGLIVGDPEAAQGLDRKGLVGAIHGSLQRSFFEILGDFFFEMHQGLPQDDQDRRDSLEGLRSILGALPDTAFDEISPEPRGPAPKETAFGKTDFSKRFGGHDKDDPGLGSSQLGMFLMMNRLRLEATVTDGNCLYDALRLQLHQVQHLDVATDALRTAVAALVDANRVRFAPFLASGVDNAIRRIMTTRSWDNEGGDLAAQVIATVLQRDVIVLSPRGIDVRHPDNSLARPDPARIESNGQPLTIVYNGHSHYYSTSPL